MSLAVTYTQFQKALAELLSEARRASARSINAILTATYWEIGRRILTFEQGGNPRAPYGEALLEHLAKDLTSRFGRGFSVRNLGQMRTFFELWPPEKIRQTVSAKSSETIPQTVSAEWTGLPLANLAQALPLPWSHYVRLITVKDLKKAKGELGRGQIKGGAQ